MRLKKNEKADAPGFDADQFAAAAEQRPTAKKAKKRQPTSFLMPDHYSNMLDEMSAECNSRVAVMKAGLIALYEMSPEERFKLYMQASKKTD